MDFSGSIFETTIEIGQLSEYRPNLKVWYPCHWLVGWLTYFPKLFKPAKVQNIEICEKPLLEISFTKVYKVSENYLSHFF